MEREYKGLVSIVIPAYNAGKYLREMLESIYAQTYSHIEVIVAYDTKSSDNTLEILQTYSKKYGLIIDIGRDSSSGDARNRGFKLVRGEYVIFMDADDFITSTYIEDLMSIYAEHPKLNAVCGNMGIQVAFTDGTTDDTDAGLGGYTVIDPATATANPTQYS